MKRLTEKQWNSVGRLWLRIKHCEIYQLLGYVEFKGQHYDFKLAKMTIKQTLTDVICIFLFFMSLVSILQMLPVFDM